jgi:hypothetical protein
MPRGMEPALGMCEAIVMNNEERRLILDRGFERTLETVLDAFLREGFCINPIGAGDLHRPESPGHAKRYAMCDAALPELVFRSKFATDPPALFGCRVSIFELTASCTLVTIERPIERYPVLTTLVPRVAERIERAVRTLIHQGVLTAA